MLQPRWIFMCGLTKDGLLCHLIMRQKAAGQQLINIVSLSEGYTTTATVLQRLLRRGLRFMHVCVSAHYRVNVCGGFNYSWIV